MATMGNAVDRPSPPSIARLKREPSLTRRRKPSVTDLGLMATVQEFAMDSRKFGANFAAIGTDKDSYYSRKIPSP